MLNKAISYISRLLLIHHLLCDKKTYLSLIKNSHIDLNLASTVATSLPK